jgi:hypothetical protein
VWRGGGRGWRAGHVSHMDFCKKLKFKKGVNILNTIRNYNYFLETYSHILNILWQSVIIVLNG